MVVGPEESDAIEVCLDRLMEDTGASYIMLLDRSGQVIAWKGDGHRAEMTHLGALLAGAYASSREMARLLKEDNFRVLLQEGMRERVFTETVEDRWLLVVVFDHQAHLGLVKVLAKRATQSLAGVLHVVIERSNDGKARITGELRRAAVDTIDLIFSQDDRATESPATDKK
jgi:predicted regulator of Ras-like GTPase activity (Roadblock/LC7/MglB family)